MESPIFQISNDELLNNLWISNGISKCVQDNLIGQYSTLLRCCLIRDPPASHNNYSDLLLDFSIRQA